MRILTIILRLCLLTALIAWYYSQDISFSSWASDSTIQQERKSIFEDNNWQGQQDFLQTIQPVTWILLQTTKNSNPRKIWSDTMFGQSTIFYWRLYSRSNKEATLLLESLAKEQTDIQIILEDKQYRQYSDTFWAFANYYSWYDNVQVQSDKKLWTNFNHTKTFITDNRVSIQTANITKSAFTSNREHFFLTQNKEIKKNLIELFQKDRQWDPLTSSDMHPNLLVCPIDCREKLFSLIENTESSIRMMHQYMTDKNLQSLIKSKKGNWLDVRLIFSNHDSAHDLQDYLWPNVVRIMTKPHNHSKTILVDNTYLILWSMNLSPNAMDNNREISIIITDRTIIEQWKQQVREEWNAIRY